MKERFDRRKIHVERRAQWFVMRLYSGDMTATDESELLGWLAEDTDHRQAYERLLHLRDLSGDLAGDKDIAALTKGALHARTRKGFDRRWIGLAAAVFLVAVTGVVTRTFLVSTDGTRILETALGDQQTFVLRDGSSVTLNSGSRALIDFDSLGRRILLDFGEIFLAVAKDPERTLTIRAGDHVVTALGTKFSVHLSGHRLEIAVAEGRVAVSDDNIRFPRQTEFLARFEAGSLILDAGSVARFEQDQQTVTEDSIAEVERLQSWRSGRVRFEDQTLMDVISEVNRYSSVKVLIEDSTIADLRISAVLNLDQVEMTGQVELLLSSLEDIHPIKVVRHPDRFVLIADRGTRHHRS
ncbi:MAG: FecR domain-containing protein [Gammaproteobacteria bacterium]|nr:FecR domain-containing protein [Gammaproteobacteria bacterium]